VALLIGVDAALFSPAAAALRAPPVPSFRRLLCCAPAGHPNRRSHCTFARAKARQGIGTDHAWIMRALIGLASSPDD